MEPHGGTAPKKRICAGLLAHVDAGKTTLSEGLLYCAGALKRLGRVDHRDAFLDTDALERERGITIFSKQARLSFGNLELTLLDTPGHVDFSAETERVLQVLDYAILVISATDGVQSHTRTLWRLLESYRVPTFIFVNKTDLPGLPREELLAGLRRSLSPFCLDLTPGREDELAEEAAMADEELLEFYLENGALPAGALQRLVAARRVFPCYFGAALRTEGVAELLAGLEEYTVQPQYPAEFGARVYKIGRDAQGARLTFLKVTGGELKVKAALSNWKAAPQGGGSLAPDEVWEQKADQLRLYSGAKFTLADTVPAGGVCAVTGLTRTRPGQGLGAEAGAEAPLLAPVLACGVILPEGADAHAALDKLSLLADEDPQLHIVWDERLQEIQMQLMGQVQLEVVQRLARERFGLEIDFSPARVLYRETIRGRVEGVGHFEPLRHYAEVHLILEEGEPGSGLQFDTVCGEDELDKNWQRLILTHLQEREHPGVLLGAPITDMRVTLAAGKAHLKHTEGGDFRQATYRAVRQGLMQAQSVLLEPWYEFRLELPAENLGRAIADVQQMGGDFAPPETQGEAAVLCGSAPVARMREYARDLAAYTRGRGRLMLEVKGYLPCHNAAEVLAAAGYDPERDAGNPPDSVFCSHGAGYTVKWDEVPAHMHLPAVLKPAPQPEEEPRQTAPRAAVRAGSPEEDKQLAAIFEKTYGPVKGADPFALRRAPAAAPEYHYEDKGPEYLLVDGYNIIFAWDDLAALARTSLDAARLALADILCNYRGFCSCEVILVFDAYRVKRSTADVLRRHNITVVYTKEAETADMYIEKATYDIGKKHRVRVATSDAAEQMIVLGHGAMRISARAFREEVERVNCQIAQIIEKNNMRR